MRGERAGIDRVTEQIDDRFDFSSIYNGPLGEIVDRVKWWSMTQTQKRALYLSMMTDLVEIAKFAPERQFSSLPELDKKWNSSWSPAGVVIALYRSRGVEIVRAQAALSAAVAAISAERFRLAHGRWPGKLDELVPAYLAALPLDPCNGKPLRMKQVDGGLIIYSVGTDQVDNDGQIDGPVSSRTADIGFRLFDPAQRRQSPRSSEKATSPAP